MKNIVIEPRIENIDVATDFLDEILETASIELKIITKINIVVDEILSNIINYSNATEVEIEIDISNKDINICFSDDGIAYDPTMIEEPDVTLSAEERKIGGLGMFMVRKLMDNVEYEYINKKNNLKINKSIK